jgi:hypothetical protein
MMVAMNQAPENLRETRWRSTGAVLSEAVHQAIDLKRLWSSGIRPRFLAQISGKGRKIIALGFIGAEGRFYSGLGLCPSHLRTRK